MEKIYSYRLRHQRSHYERYLCAEESALMVHSDIIGPTSIFVICGGGTRVLATNKYQTEDGYVRLQPKFF